jgi:hypothetical protein
MRVFESTKPQSILFRTVLGIGTVSMTVALGSFAYLGTFTRYLADDYCEAVQVNSGSLLQALIERYETSSDRYSNLLFVALSEFVFPHNVEILPAVMIVLWTAALTWLVFEARRMLGLHWHFLIDLFLAGLLAFFSILQAPNRFQTIYWRSAMATHFAPLVYLTAFTAFLLMLIRRNENRYPAVWIGFLCLGIAFLGGGFSEPPDAVLITVSALALAAVWLWEKGSRRRPTLMLLSWTLAGGLLALIVMAVSPGNLDRSQLHRPGLIDLIYHTFLNAALFFGDTFLGLPVPTLFSAAMPFFLFYGIFAKTSSLSSSSRRMMFIIMFATPILAYFLTAASFAPSVYGQAFPAERARFLARLLLTAALMLDGACLGILLAQWKTGWSSTAAMLAMVLFVFSALYPLRSAWNAVQDKIPYYHRWSSLWDDRQAQIVADKAEGMNDIVAANLYSIEGVEELKVDPKYWINVCAANYYGVHSISVP